MRYTSQSDAQLMRRRALDPSILVRRLNFGSLTQGGTVSSAARGASVGASIGSVFPVVGTAIGALVGGAVGAIASAFNRQDQEVQNFDQAQAIAHQSGASAVLNIQNKYLVIAGLMDLEAHQIKGNIPFYKKYGRLGEYAFITDMCQQVQAAANAGVISDNDTPQSVYSKVVLPWINRMGYGSFADSNAEMIGYILMGMIAEYCANIFSQRWYARGGDMPFGDLHPFTLPQVQQPAQPQITASPTPSPQAQMSTTAVAVPQVPAELQRYMNSQMPNVGDLIGYAFNGSTFLQLPPHLVFEGVDGSTRAWIVQDGNGQQYELQGSTLQPIQKQAVNSLPSQTVVSQIPGTQPQVGYNAPPPVTAQDASGTNIPAQYIPAGGGGGGPLLPVNTAPSVPAATTGLNLNMEEIGLGVGLLALVFFMMGHRR